MSFTFEKVDPACFNVLPISWAEDPVQSLSTINLNFENLDTELCNISFSAKNIWNGLYTDFASNSSNWDAVYTTINSFSACWQSTYLTVNSLSAGWLSPITVVYPDSVNAFNRDILTNFVKTHYPTVRGGCRNYLDGQLLRIFLMELSNEEQKVTANCKPVKNKKNVPCYCIGRAVQNISVKCQCRPERFRIKDKFVKRVRGIELEVQNAQWVYTRDLQ